MLDSIMYAITDNLIEFIVIGIMLEVLFTYLSGMKAWNKGRNVYLWVVLGILFSFITYIIICILPTNYKVAKTEEKKPAKKNDKKQTA